MTKLVLSNLSNLQNESTTVSTINNNNAAMTNALENTLSRDGTSPNQMTADLDMNSNQILNLPDATSPQEPVTLSQFEAAAIAIGAAPLSASYVTLGTHAGLSNERVLTGGTGITLTDGGPNNTLTINSTATSAVTKNAQTGTTYTVISSDSGKIITSNNSAKVTWTLNASLGSGFAFYAKNVSTGPLFLVPSGTAKINRFSKIILAKDQTAYIICDGTDFNAMVSPFVVGNDLATVVGSISYSTTTIGPFFTLSGTPTVGNIVGLDFVSTTPPFTVQLRHTYVGGDTLETAAKDIVEQFKANATVQANIGYDVAQYAVAVQSGSTWLVAFDLIWPFVTASGQVFNAFASGGSTSSFTPSSSSGTNRLEAGDFIVLGRASRYAGREPLAGDGIGGIFVTGETTGNSINVHDFQPIYASMQYGIVDPTPGQAKGSINNTCGEFYVSTSGPWGLGKVGINTTTPKTAYHLNLNAGTVPNAPLGTTEYVTGADGVISVKTISTFGAGVYSGYSMLAARGTGATPTAIQSGDLLGFIGGGGYGTSAYSAPTAQIQFITTENFTNTANGSKMLFYTTPNGSASPLEAGRFNSDQSLTLASSLFLASGKKIDFNAGNATLTHSAGLLTSNVNIAVPDDAYDATTWNGSVNVPTKNAVRDKIEAGITTKVVNATYDLSTASGTQDITGFGFNPSAVSLSFGVISGGGGGSGHASSNGATQGCSVLTSDSGISWIRQSGQAILYCNSALSLVQQGVVSFITDGIRITWTKTGSPTGTYGMTVLGYK